LNHEGTKGTKKDVKNFWICNIFGVFDLAVLGALGAFVVQSAFALLEKGIKKATGIAGGF
jgi:hypothetical protein